MILKHATHASSCWPYAHDWFEDDIFIKNAKDWDEVVARMADPKATKFKAMIWEEQTTILEQSAQDILRARGERIAYEPVEAMEAPQEAT